jgi:hypothetical protein
VLNIACTCIEPGFLANTSCSTTGSFTTLLCWFPNSYTLRNAFIYALTEQDGVAATLQVSVRVVLGSNVGQGIEYSV